MTNSDPRRKGALAKVFGSGIARRILLLFVLSSALPLGLFAYLSLTNVTRQLTDNARDVLHSDCKEAGMDLVERFHRLSEDLELAVPDSSASELHDERNSLVGRMTTRFEWIALLDSEGQLVDERGTSGTRPELSAAELAHVRVKHRAILVRAGEGGFAELFVAVGIGERLLLAEVVPDYLWERPQHRSAASDVLVRAETGELLFASRELQPLEQRLVQGLRRNTSGEDFRWSDDGGEHLASYRTVFTKPQFYSNFVIASSKPESIVLAPIAYFEQTFLLFGALTFLLVCIASVVQIRKSLVPIVILREATERIANGAEDEHVEIDSGDEFEELAASFNFMADRIRERTSELERANRAKANFLANMSHEIRTPMNAVLGYLELASEVGLPEPERMAHLELIKKNGEHLLGVINSILDVSRIEAGHVATAAEVCAPAELVSDVVDLLRHEADVRGLALTIEQDATIPERLTSDPQRLRQILINVIGNAIKYTERGAVHVTTRWRSEGRAGRLAIEVADTGSGIPTDKLEQIFEAFYQADTSMSRRHGGTGLGLGLSRELARLLGGDVTVSSRPGQGSTFTIEVRCEVPDVAPPALPSAPAAKAVAEAPLDARRVLVVDDVAVNRKLISAFLRRSEFQIEEAENGLVALEKGLEALSANEPYGVILMDMQMPEMDGYEATGELRAGGYRGPIVALTAHAFEGERERCLEAGCDDFATKPIDNQTLLALVRRHILGEVAAEREAPRAAD